MYKHWHFIHGSLSLTAVAAVLMIALYTSISLTPIANSVSSQVAGLNDTNTADSEVIAGKKAPQFTIVHPEVQVVANNGVFTIFQEIKSITEPTTQQLVKIDNPNYGDLEIRLTTKVPASMQNSLNIELIDAQSQTLFAPLQTQAPAVTFVIPARSSYTLTVKQDAVEAINFAGVVEYTVSY